MKSSVGGSLVFMDSDEDMQDALSGDMNEKNEDGDFEEEEDNDHVLSDTEEDEFGGEESDYGFDETMTDELQPSRRYGQPTYMILSEKDIKHRQDEAVSKVVGVLSISRIEAGILLRHFKWSVNRVNDEWFTDEDKVRRTLGLFVKPASGVRIDSKELACGICFEPWPREAMKSAVCGHYFCNLCWTGYAHTSINDGMGCLMLRCPQPDCHASVGEDIILSLVTDDDRARYTRYMLRSYVEDNRKMKWCPGRDCEYAVDFTPGSAPYDIVCKCGHNFCWNCLEDAHRPVDCDTVSKWILKNCAESENMNWILANSKPCPKCKRPIEKNQGCMHITCTPPCKFEFCWLCLGAWSEHGERTGGFYACNKYEVAKQEGLYDEAERRREMAKNSLERYTHYYERWATNESSRAKALSDLQQMEAIQIELLSEMQCQPVSQLKFVTESWLQIIECRRVLKWTYAYGYYIPEQELAKRSLFEYLQGEAEAGLERLHKCAEKDLQNYLEAAHAPSQICFNDFRTRLAGLTSVTKNYFENLVRALENGLADVNSKQQLVGGGKASSSSSSKASSSGGGKVKPMKPRGSTSKSNASRQEEDAEDDSFWACNACTFNNGPQATLCAMCQRPRF